MEVPLDPDREQARRWLQDELDRPGYTVDRSVVSRVWGWISDHLPRVDLAGTLPGWAAWVTLGLVLLAALSVIAFVSADRTRRASLILRPAPGAVLEEEGLGACDYLARAVAALQSGDVDAALVDGYRAITAGAVERTLLDDRPGRTAHEVATDLGPLLPGSAHDLAVAATWFDAVRYGDHHATVDQSRTVLSLQQRIADARPTLSGTS